MIDNQPHRCRRAPLRAVVILGAAVVAMATVGCSSTSNHAGTVSSSAPSSSSSSTATGSSGSATYPAAKQQLCQARDQLKTSVQALTKASLLVGGTTAIKAAVDKVQTDLTDLKAAAQQTYGPQVDAMQTALTQLETAVGTLGTGSATQNLQAVGTAIAPVGTTSADLFTTLKSACG